MENLSRIQIFVKVGDLKSFTEAAQELRQTPSGVSKAVRLLESELGVQLFRRTTRTVRFTPDGAVFYESCKRALGDLQEAREAITRVNCKPRGTLRLDVPVSYGHRKIVPHLHRLTERYPDLKLEVSITDRFTDLVQEGIDVAVRIGELEDSALFMRRLGEIQTIVCASPKYLEKAGTPRTIEDLKKHRLITYLSMQEGEQNFEFVVDGKLKQLQVDGSLKLSTGDAILAALRQGAGIAQIHGYSVDEDLKKGRLVALLSKFRPHPVPVSAIYLPHRHLSPRVKVCLDFLSSILG